MAVLDAFYGELGFCHTLDRLDTGLGDARQGPQNRPMTHEASAMAMTLLPQYSRHIARDFIIVYVANDCNLRAGSLPSRQCSILLTCICMGGELNRATGGNLDHSIAPALRALVGSGVRTHCSSV
jgi:hypothetical protein